MMDDPPTRPLSVEAVSRVPNHETVLAVHLSREPTDAEMLSLHDALWKIVNEG